MTSSAWRSSLATAALAGLALATGACSLGGGLSGPAPDFAGCGEATEFAFIGEATPAELGFGDMVGQDAGRRGMVWVTMDPVDLMGPGPRPPGMELPLSRAVCIEWPDGSGMAGPIDDDWQPPGLFATTAAEGQPLPMMVLVLVGVAVLVIGVSYLAFRQDQGPGTTTDRG